MVGCQMIEEAYISSVDTAKQINFIEAPDAQMQLAGRLWGHCCICGKELTDPISLERGIGPECLQHREVRSIRWLHGHNESAEAIAVKTGMPVEFVNAVVSEMALSPIT
jgi:hypothetical protein